MLCCVSGEISGFLWEWANCWRCSAEKLSINGCQMSLTSLSCLVVEVNRQGRAQCSNFSTHAGEFNLKCNAQKSIANQKAFILPQTHDNWLSKGCVKHKWRYWLTEEGQLWFTFHSYMATLLFACGFFLAVRNEAVWSCDFTWLTTKMRSLSLRCLSTTRSYWNATASCEILRTPLPQGNVNIENCEAALLSKNQSVWWEVCMLELWQERCRQHSANSINHMEVLYKFASSGLHDARWFAVFVDFQAKKQEGKVCISSRFQLWTMLVKIY